MNNPRIPKRITIETHLVTDIRDLIPDEFYAAGKSNDQNIGIDIVYVRESNEEEPYMLPITDVRPGYRSVPMFGNGAVFMLLPACYRQDLMKIYHASLDKEMDHLEKSRSEAWAGERKHKEESQTKDREIEALKATIKRMEDAMNPTTPGQEEASRG